MPERSEAEFDAHAEGYDADLDRGLRVTGAGKVHYARERIALFERLAVAGDVGHVRRVLDFGCGDGDASPRLQGLAGAPEVIGVDVSPGMLTVARARHPGFRFELIDDIPTLDTFDLAYCNGVFHHIPVVERPAAARCVFNALRPGGLFGVWENNPWNPGTRFVMRRIAFDRDAIMLSPPELRALLRSVGFTIVRSDHLFILPGTSSIIRRLERAVSRLPIGGQYQVLARRPA